MSAAAPLTSSAGRHAGFTLVEVLVALLVMSIMAAMAWQGLDGISRSRAGSEEQVERILRLNTVLAQWEQDLAAVEETTSSIPSAITFDGATVRLTRTTEDGIAVVAWSLRQGQWMRWMSRPARTLGELEDAYARSRQLMGTEPGQMRVLSGVRQWQVYFYIGNAWANAQSSLNVAQPQGGATPPGGQPQLATPDGVRIVMAFNEGSGYVGTLTRDVRTRP
jgi:general secretion pathway protein J